MATIAAKPRFSACSATVPLEEPGEAAPRVVVAQALLGEGGETVEVLLEDRLDERGLGREAAVERPHADARAARDLVDRHLEAELGERLGGRCEDAAAVRLGVPPQAATAG